MHGHKKKPGFISLLMDEAFVRRVQHAKNHDKLGEQLEAGNKENAKAVLYAIKFIRMNQSKKREMRPTDFNRILKAIQANDGKSTIAFKKTFVWLQVAAIVLVILSVGGVVFYRQFIKDPLTEFAQQEVPSNKQGLLILSDGSKQVLKENDSFIDYNSSKGKIVIEKEKEKEIIEAEVHKKETELNQIVVPYGQRQKVLLSDGTLVQLNAGSQLTFPTTFSGKTREVYLKGEGFFEVHKNLESPFIVKTGYLDIKVLGTRFNVTAYDDEHLVSTVLVEGKVNVAQKEKLFANYQVNLAPGQGCFYSINDKNSTVKNVDINDYISWTEGLQIFRKAPLGYVVSRICRYYDQKIQIENDKLANITLSGKFMLTDDLDEVLNNLSKTLEARLEKTDDGNYLLKQ